MVCICSPVMPGAARVQWTLMYTWKQHSPAQGTALTHSVSLLHPFLSICPQHQGAGHSKACHDLLRVIASCSINQVLQGPAVGAGTGPALLRRGYHLSSQGGVCPCLLLVQENSEMPRFSVKTWYLNFGTHWDTHKHTHNWFWVYYINLGSATKCLLSFSFFSSLLFLGISSHLFV